VLEAETVFEWLAAVKWLYEQVDGKAPDVHDVEPEMIIRVVREDSPHPQPLSMQWFTLRQF
jgi:hypothetical protein